MKHLIYVPLEHIDQRYTVHLDADIENYLVSNNIGYLKVRQPNIQTQLKPGMFLDASGTIQTKAHQIKFIAELYGKGLVTDDTSFFFSDLWFPGIESLAYLNYFYKVNPKIKGIIHAGSFTDTDFVRDMERWAKGFEDIVFDICDEIFVASNFIKNDILKKRMVSSDKITVTHLPLDSNLNKYKSDKRNNTVIFNGRLCDEKQPWLFDQLSEKFRESGYEFIKTQELSLNKNEYYQLLSKSKAVVSYALQENFGYGVAEAVKLGCIPILPNRLVYPELYDKKYLFNTFEDSFKIMQQVIDGKLDCPKLNINNPFNTWFK